MTARTESDRLSIVGVTATRIVPKPWGHEEIFALVPGKFCGKTLHVNAGEALSLQYHAVKDEVIAVQSGSIVLEIGLDDTDLQATLMEAGETVHVPPGVRHRVTAIEDAVLLEASTTELTDVVRLEDRYGRRGTTAP
jgi:mannose-6-phosphate isomerase-like protein (cupin superfamily)